MKEWFDLVLEFGWAYGEGGDRLHGKSVLSAITTGGSKEAYCAEGHNQYSVPELLRPIEQTASLCGMTYEDPFVVYGALSLTPDERAAKVAEYRELLSSD